MLAQRAGPRPQWLLFNDFAISAMPAEEVRRLYGGQKLPVLMYYSRVRLHACNTPCQCLEVALLSHRLMHALSISILVSAWAEARTLIV